MKKFAGVLLVVLVLQVFAGPALAAPGFQVIVHPSVPGRTVERSVLANIFLKKAVRWGDERRIEPIDLTATSSVRETFTTEVLGMTTKAVGIHWMSTVSTGLRPPSTRATEREIIEFVAKTPGAVGYVAADTALPPTVKAVTLK